MDCIVKKNLGVGNCPALPSFIKGIIETDNNFSATPEEAADPTFWQDAILAAYGAGRIFYWPDLFNFTDQSEAAVYQTTYLGKRSVRAGFYDFLVGISESLCVHTALFTHKRTSGRVFLIDGANQIIGTVDDDGNYRGLQVQLINPEKMKFNDGSNVSVSPVDIVLKDNTDLDERGVMFDGSFLPSLSRLTDVTLSVVSASSSKLVIKAVITCDGTPLSGLKTTSTYDFAVFNEDGTSHAITSITEGTGDNVGIYTINGTSFGAGWVSLVAPDQLSIQAYEAEKVFVLGGS